MTFYSWLYESFRWRVMETTEDADGRIKSRRVCAVDSQAEAVAEVARLRAKREASRLQAQEVMPL